VGLIDALTRLDERALPRLARGYARLSRRARRIRVRPLTLASMILAVVVVGTAIWRLNEPPALDTGGGSTVRVGVRDGDVIAQYVAVSRAELQRLAGSAAAQQPLYALVSFATYLSPEQLTDLAERTGAGLQTVAAYARVPLPRRQTQLVRLAAGRLPYDVTAAMAEVAEHKARDAAVYAHMAQAEADPRVRGLYQSNEALAAQEAQAYGHECACIYALVARAAPQLLLDIAAQKQVRVIDPAPEVGSVDLAVFTAPLPEQLDRVQPPADDGMPDASPSPSPPLQRPPGPVGADGRQELGGSWGGKRPASP
jgi:hypothetical protein